MNKYNNENNNENNAERYYKALIEKDLSFEGTFFVGVKTTGVFCHSTCPARKPKFENCEFFSSSKQALLAGFRPCKRCNPLSNPRSMPPSVKALVSAVENNPEKKWTDADFEALSISSYAARRQFYKQFAMTFVEYARSRRLGSALKEIKNGTSMINAQLNAGYESDSGFRDAFKNTYGLPISKKNQSTILCSQWLETPLGSMLAIASEKHLYLLEFVDRRGLEKEIEKLRNRLNAIIVPKNNAITMSIEQELSRYFKKEIKDFNTPIMYLGSEFQINVWETLRKIPLGDTISYSNLAVAIGNPQAIRAVARANGFNQLSIIVPCHRVINKNGELGGYGGGVERKLWLLKHEKELSEM